jgi:hypothetical protein
MEKHYIRKEIKSESDLPKEDKRYYFHLKGNFDLTSCIIPSAKYNQIKKRIDWYLIEAPSEVTDYPSDEEIRKHAEWAFGLSKAFNTGWSREVVDKIMDLYCDGAKWMRERMGQGSLREELIKFAKTIYVVNDKAAPIGSDEYNESLQILCETIIDNYLKSKQ